MKTYELSLHLSGKLEEREAKDVLEKIKKSLKGKILQESEIKKISLAYPIKKEISSFLTSLVFESLNEDVVNFREFLRHEEKVLRYLLLVKKSALKKISKKKITKRLAKKRVKKGTKESETKFGEAANKKEDKKKKKTAIKKEPKIKLEDIDKSLEKLFEKEL